MYKYFVYTHSIVSTNQIFYVGIGTYHYKNRPYRAFNFHARARNFLWINIFNENNKECIVKIILESNDLNEVYSKEIELISQYGKLIDNSGILANISDGGEFMGFKGKPIACYTRDGNFYKIFEDVKSATLEFNISRDAIYASLNNDKISVHNYIFRYVDKKIDLFIDISNIRKSKEAKAIYQYSLEGKLIKYWKEGCDFASKSLNIDRGSLRRCLLKKALSAKGFVWSYEPIVFDKEIYLIGQYTMNDELIKIFDNAGKAQKITGIHNSTILLCCKGKQKSVNNFKWKFIKKQTNEIM